MADIRKFRGRAAIAGSLPSAAVDTGAASRAVAAAGESLSSELGVMADKAAAREGALEGLTAAQRASAGYLARRDTELRATTRSVQVPANLDAAIEQAAARYGENANDLRLIAYIESGGDPNAKNPNSTAKGAFQFVDATAKDYGLTNPYDVAASSDAAARLLRDNRKALTSALGRNPTGAELYLAHQQGAGGAVKLLSNPDALAASIVGMDAVMLNGGSADMTAASFAAKWLNKANGIETTAPLAADGTVADILSVTPLQLRNDGTIRGEAFDDAARRATAWRMEAGLTEDLAQAAIANEGNPQGYTDAAAQIRQSYLTNSGITADPQLLEAFDQSFAQRTASDRLQLLAQQEARLRDGETAATATGIAALEKDLERQAYNFGSNPDGDAALTGQLGRAEAMIDAAVAAQAITPAAAMTAKASLWSSVARGRITGVFENLPTPAQKEAYALGLLDDWAKGEGTIAQLGLEEVRALSSHLYSVARTETNAQTTANTIERVRYEGMIADDLSSIAKTGAGIDFGAVGIPIDNMKAILKPEDFAKWREGRQAAHEFFEATVGMETETAAAIAERIEALTPEPGQIGYARSLDVVEQVKAHAKTILDQRAADPLGQADAAGAIALKPVDFTTADALGTSLATRIADARAVAGLYGTPVTFFQPHEKAALVAGLLAQPAMIPDFALAIVKSAGNDAPKILAEISEQGPVLAHVAGLALDGADTSVATDVAQVLALRQAGQIAVTVPDETKLSTAAGGILGDALSRLPGTQAAVLGTAALLYELEASRLGFDPAKPDDPDTAAHAAYERALNRALGMRMVGGEQWGGLTTVNGAPVVAPSSMPAARVGELLGGLTSEELKALPPILSGSGVPMTAEQLRRAHLVSIGDGRYRVALGDPNGFDPQWVLGTEGYWTLDIKQLDQLRSTAADVDRSDQFVMVMPPQI